MRGIFFNNILKERGVRQVLDMATGTGFRSIRLLKAGFDMISADDSPEMLAQAFENGRRAGFIMRTIQAGWRWLSRDIHNKFGAVICLVKSLPPLIFGAGPPESAGGILRRPHPRWSLNPRPTQL